MSRRGLQLALAVITVVAAVGWAAGTGVAATAAVAHGLAVPAQDGSEESYTPKGPLVADTGFRARENGFAFENYGKGPYKNLTPAELRKLFGDEVCASAPGDECELIPPARQWLDENNKAMKAGHCYGFSVASLQLFKSHITPDQFGAGTVPDVRLERNDAVQRGIAYSFVYQSLDSVSAAKITGTPNEIVDKLIEVLKPDAAETYTIGFSMPNGDGGHAVTPYAVEDRGDGTFGVLIYDNNYPKITRAIIVDRNANSWSYDASTNPEERSAKYRGDATTKTLGLYPTGPGMGVQPCPFCRGRAQSGGPGTRLHGQGGPQGEFNELYLEGNPRRHAHLLITDDQGRRYGYAGKQFVTEIPGVQHRVQFLSSNWKEAEEPVYQIPVGIHFSVTIDGSSLKKPDSTKVLMLGPGYDLAVDGIDLQPGEQDTLTVSPDGRDLQYKTPRSQSPDLELGFEESGADHALQIKGHHVNGGGELHLTIDPDNGKLTINTPTASSAGAYDLVMDRISEQGSLHFEHRNLELATGESATLDYANWKEDGEKIPLEVNKPGEPVQIIELTDQR
jgi:hypothetical protein